MFAQKFKHAEGQFGPFIALAVGSFQFKHQGRDAVAQLRVLIGERRLIDRARQMKVQQPVLLTCPRRRVGVERPWPVPDFARGRVFCWPLVRSGTSRGSAAVVRAWPGIRRVAVQSRFVHAIARMAGCGVSRAAVVHILLARLLGNDLAGDGPTAVTARDQFTGVCQFVAFVNLIAKEFLNAVEGVADNDSPTPPLNPAAVILHVADV